jgi:hypothetical protein
MRGGTPHTSPFRLGKRGLFDDTLAPEHVVNQNPPADVGNDETRAVECDFSRLVVINPITPQHIAGFGIASFDEEHVTLAGVALEKELHTGDE